MITNNYYITTQSTGFSEAQYSSIFSLLNTVKMTTQEAVDKVNAQTLQLNKISGEVTAVKNALSAAVAAGETVPEALAAAINSAGEAIQQVDDLNVDAAAEGTSSEGTAVFETAVV